MKLTIGGHYTVEWAQFGHLNATLFPSTFHVPIAYQDPNLIGKSI